MVNIKENKRKIRMLRKFKKDTKVGTENRRQINKQIKELKNELDNIYTCNDPEKEKLIDKINVICPHITDLRKFKTEQLQLHYNKLMTEDYRTKWNNLFKGII